MSTYSLISKSDGVLREVIASIPGTGAALTVNPGFQPRRVILYDDAGVLIWTWVQGLPAGHTFKSAAGGLAVDTGSAIVVTSKDTESAADIAAGNIEPGVTFSATALANGRTLIAVFE